MSEKPHKLGEILRNAREERGIDLARVERDTKIRSRYLSALERSEFRDLPGPVYTKGFLRNYAEYLNLDPEYLLDLYRIESAEALAQRPTAPTMPRPIARRSRALVVTPGAVAAAILTALVVLFVAWLGYEFVTFAGTPELRVTDPPGNAASVTAARYVIRGETVPNARITVEGLAENPTLTAEPDGSFRIPVELVPGSNVITLTANDPVTGRDSPSVRVTILVGREASPSPSPGQLAVTAPEPDASMGSPVPLGGTAGPGTVLTATPSLVEQAPLTFRILNLAGQQVPVEASPPAVPAPVELTAAADGTFSGELPLAPGTWDIAFAAGEGGATETRRVVVAPPAGLSGRLEVSGGISYLEVEEDGVRKAEVSHRNVPAGTAADLGAQRTIRIRAGNAAAVRININGVEIGAMGGSGAVVEWRIERIG